MAIYTLIDASHKTYIMLLVVSNLVQWFNKNENGVIISQKLETITDKKKFKP